MLKKYVYISCVKEKNSGDIREYQRFESTKYWYSIGISQALLFSATVTVWLWIMLLVPL